jgi:hypothetical protein
LDTFALAILFPRIGSQIIIEPGSPEEFHVMEVKKQSSDELNVARFRAIASGKQGFLRGF